MFYNFCNDLEKINKSCVTNRMVTYFGWTLVLGPRPPAHHDAPSFTFSSPLCWTLGRFRSSAHRRPPSPFKKLEGSSRGRSVPGSSAPSVRPPPRMSDEARRGPAGAAQVVLRASSEDRKPVGSGSPPPAATATAVAHKIQLKSADMKEEMRQEAFEIARIVRTLCPCSRSAFFLRSIWFPSLPLLTGSSLGMGFGHLGTFLSIPSLSVRHSRSTVWRRTSRST
jgi:hypothetical protein